MLLHFKQIFFDVGVESGPHVDFQPMISIALVSRVVNMLGVYEDVLYFGSESGQHVEIILICF